MDIGKKDRERILKFAYSMDGPGYPVPWNPPHPVAEALRRLAQGQKLSYEDIDRVERYVAGAHRADRRVLAGEGVDARHDREVDLAAR